MSDYRLRLLQGSDADLEEIAATLDVTRIRILLTGAQPEWRHQVLALTLADLVGRLFPNVITVCDFGAAADPRLPPGPAGLAERLDQARARGGLTPGSSTNTDIVVQVGPGASTADFYVDGCGWESFVGTESSRLVSYHSDVCIGPLAAACRVGAAIFARAIQTYRPPGPGIPRSAYASALSFERSTDPLGEVQGWSGDIDALLVGAGSIGGALVYSVAFTPGVRGRLTVLDPQNLESHNHVRALLPSSTDAGGGQPKIDVVSKALEHRRDLEVRTRQLDVTEYHATLAQDEPLPLVVCAVDQLESRRAVQDCLPLHVLNAACHPEEISISGHVTDAGPCICCLHMADVLDEENIRTKLVAKSTGIPLADVTELMAQRAPLGSHHLRVIEKNRGLRVLSLDHYEGRTLDELWEAQLLYGAVSAELAEGSAVAVASPFVTTLAGVLLAAELLKASDESLRRFTLGPHGVHIKYEERVYVSSLEGLLTSPPRWPTPECLCRSTRRLGLLRRRYGLKPW